MIDLNQVSLAIRNCTSRSMVLLDEFGKGTLSTGSFPLWFTLLLSCWTGLCSGPIVLVSICLPGCSGNSLLRLLRCSLDFYLTDGAGLLCGVLKHFISLGPSCPKVLATTHFHDIFRNDILNPEDLPITFTHMQVLFTSSDGREIVTSEANSIDKATGYAYGEGQEGNVVKPNERITYLYRYVGFGSVTKNDQIGYSWWWCA